MFKELNNIKNGDEILVRHTVVGMTTSYKGILSLEVAVKYGNKKHVTIEPHQVVTLYPKSVKFMGLKFRALYAHEYYIIGILTGAICTLLLTL